MESKLFYLCDSTDSINRDFTDGNLELELYVPFYEDVTMKDDEEYTVSSLLDDFCFLGERCYYSFDVKAVSQYIVPVSDVCAYIHKGYVQITYKFENGEEYIPRREYIIGIDLSRKDAERLVRRAKAIAPHLFMLSCPLTNDMLKYEDEKWG